MNAKLKFLAVCAWVLMMNQATRAQEPDGKEKRVISPDKQWEYRCAKYGIDQCAPEIVKAGTSQVALDLENGANVYGPEASRAEVVWGPDSKHFAFNYSPPHAHHTTYQTVVFYELKGDKWSPWMDEKDEKTMQAEIVRIGKKYFPKDVHGNGEKAEPEIVKVSNWSDANTASAYATWSDGKIGVAVTLKFESSGKCKIVNPRRLSAKELEEP